MKRLAAGQTPKPRNTGRETRDTGSETRNVLSTTAARPMEEGLAKKEKRPNGFFKRMSDDRLIEYTQEVMKENGITTRSGLAKADRRLHTVLRRRDLLGQVIPESANELHRNWVGMSDERIVEFTQEFMKEKGITTRSELEKTDLGLYRVLHRRKLTHLVEFEEVRRKERSWAMMSDKELVKAAQKFMKEKGITTREGVKKEDSGLESVLKRRNLLGQVIPESANELHRNWVGMSDERIVEFTQEFMKEKGITTRSWLKKADSGLYSVLRKRKLLELVGFEGVRRKKKNWARMSDKELVRAVQEFMKEKGITTRKGLQKADSGLHTVLRRRDLLAQVGFEGVRRKKRNWARMSDEELVRAAQEFMKEKGITTREGVKKEDSGLESVLRRRKLLDHAFAEVDEMKRAEGLDAVCTALEEFGEDG